MFYEPPYLLDLRKKTLDLEEPGIRVVDAVTGEHIASVLPNDLGLYDLHCAKTLVAMVDQLRAH